MNVKETLEQCLDAWKRVMKHELSESVRAIARQEIKALEHDLEEVEEIEAEDLDDHYASVMNPSPFEKMLDKIILEKLEKESIHA